MESRGTSMGQLERAIGEKSRTERFARRMVSNRVYDFVADTVPEKVAQYTNVERGLKGLLGEERADKVIDTRLYRTIADGVANNVFSFPVYGLNDKLAAGHSWSEVLGTRISAFFGNFVVGRPYGVYNDWMLKKFGVKKGRHGILNALKRYGANTLAFGTGQSPIYGLYLIAGKMLPGALKSTLDMNVDPIVEAFRNIDWGKIRDGAVFLTFAAPMLGGPQRWVYEKVRKQFGVNNKV